VVASQADEWFPRALLRDHCRDHQVGVSLILPVRPLSMAGCAHNRRNNRTNVRRDPVQRLSF
jgi:hypothetical protein